MKEKAVKVNEFTEVKENSPPTPFAPALYLMFWLLGDLFLRLDCFFRTGSWGSLPGPGGQRPLTASIIVAMLLSRKEGPHLLVFYSSDSVHVYFLQSILLFFLLIQWVEHNLFTFLLCMLALSFQHLLFNLLKCELSRHGLCPPSTGCLINRHELTSDHGAGCPGTPALRGHLKCHSEVLLCYHI